MRVDPSEPVRCSKNSLVMAVRWRQSSVTCILLTVLLAMLLTACSEYLERPTRIGTIVWPGYEPLYLARSINLLKPKEYKLVEMASSSQTMHALLNHRIDVACLTLDEALQVLHEGGDIRILTVLDISNGSDAVIARPGINSVRDLAGKRIAHEYTALGELMLMRLLEAASLDREQVETVPMLVNWHVQALQDGVVDAVVSFEPYVGQMQEAGGQRIFDSSEIPNQILDVLVVRAEYMQKQPQRVADLVDHWFEALRYYTAERELAVTRMLPRLNLSVDSAMAMFDGLILPDRDRNRELLLGAPARELTERGHDLVKLMLSQKTLYRPVQPERLLDQDLLEYVLQ